jgi:hypothetical protein
MKTLAELEEEKKDLEKKLRAVEEKISQHPETIGAFLTSREDLKPLIAELHLLQKTSGWTDSRKNPVEWHGYRYSFVDDPKTVYWTRYGSNWCSDFRDCGVEGDERAPDLSPSPYSLWEDNEEDDDKSFEQILKMPRHIALAYALWFTEGW